MKGVWKIAPEGPIAAPQLEWLRPKWTRWHDHYAHAPWESATAHVMWEVLKPNIGDATFCISTNCYYFKEVHSYYEWLKSSLQKAIFSE